MALEKGSRDALHAALDALIFSRSAWLKSALGVRAASLEFACAMFLEEAASDRHFIEDVHPWRFLTVWADCVGTGLHDVAAGAAEAGRQHWRRRGCLQGPPTPLDLKAHVRDPGQVRHLHIRHPLP